jgi:hypothetical protein
LVIRLQRQRAAAEIGGSTLAAYIAGYSALLRTMSRRLGLAPRNCGIAFHAHRFLCLTFTIKQSLTN